MIRRKPADRFPFCAAESLLKQFAYHPDELWVDSRGGSTTHIDVQAFTDVASFGVQIEQDFHVI